MSALYPNRKRIASGFVSNLQTGFYLHNGNNNVMENRIKEFRTKLGLSQEDVAKKIGSTRATIMKLEKGQMNLTTSWMKRLAQVFRCRPEELMSQGGGEGDLRDSEVALVDAIKDIFLVLLHHRLCDEGYLSSVLNSQYEGYQIQNQPKAMKVMKELEEFVTGKPRRSEKEIIGRLLHIPPLGSA